MRLVSLMVLASFIATAVQLYPWQCTKAAQSSTTNTALSPDADLAKLLVLINERKNNINLKGIKNINLKIDRHGKAKDVVVVSRSNVDSKNIEQRIKRAAFSTQTGCQRERKIRLVFKG